MKSIAVVVLNYKGWQDTLECIESLQSQDYTNYKIIIVDNHSDNESLGKFKDWADGKIVLESEYFLHTPEQKVLHYIEYDTEEALKGGDPEKERNQSLNGMSESIVIINNSENFGFSGGNNIGAKYAEKNNYDYILLLNNDTVIIDKHFLSKSVEPFLTDGDVYLTGPNIINFDSTFDSPMIEDTFYGNLIYLSFLNKFRKLMNCPSIYIDVKAISSRKPIQVFKVSGACMMFKTERLKEIDYLDENVWLSSEEAIVSEKVKIKGGKVMFQPLTTLIHKKAQSPRPQEDKYNILKNHYKQREYFNRTYRDYGSFKMGLIKIMTNFRLFIVKVGG